MTGCQTCGGYGMHHDPTAHDQGQAECEHEWMEFGGPGDEWRECFLCGRQEDQ